MTAGEDEAAPGTCVEDGNATYLGSDWAAISTLVEEDGNFDFSRISIHEVRALFEHGRWWEKWGKPGVEHLRQLVEGGAVDYFAFNGDGWMRICFVRAHQHMTLLEMALRERKRFGEKMERLPPGIATRRNIRVLRSELMGKVVYQVQSKLISSYGAACYDLRGWLGSYLVSYDGNAYMDERTLHGVGIGLGDKYRHHSRVEFGPNLHPLDVGVRLLLILCRLYPEHARNPILLSPSLREAADWGECMDDRGAVVSSFLVASPELLEYLDRTRVLPR